jgi:hypothetical protein
MANHSSSSSHISLKGFTGPPTSRPETCIHTWIRWSLS